MNLGAYMLSIQSSFHQDFGNDMTKSNACSVFVFQAYLHSTHVCAGLHLHDQLNANNADMEQALLFKIEIKTI